eukprot:4152836-Amphidinium_carterae.1
MVHYNMGSIFMHYCGTASRAILFQNSLTFEPKPGGRPLQVGVRCSKTLCEYQIAVRTARSPHHKCDCGFMNAMQVSSRGYQHALRCPKFRHRVVVA